MTRKCEVCLKPIRNRRADSKYCSASCAGRARRKRVTEKEKNELNGFKHVYEENDPKKQNMDKTGINELRTIEKDNFNTILNLRSEYGDKIRALENSNLTYNFTIEKLSDKIADLKEKHAKELAELREKHSKDISDANTSTTKETVQAITQMPAIQSALGAFANNLIPSNTNGLNGLADQLNIQERQIIDAIRRMQPDAQGYLAQMLYILFSKPYEEQMQIFSSLQAYMTQEEETDDI
ncbi:hypothetical protein QUH73_04355 [Labilibaculum sp. K2S]|uniref:hypothetical protein n=1 Tax=Labilibaculum sp. K2S TaxID=3056386 RepID=UPI0025A3804A|nr:hypothetical protein [Labilibaculum sp. K2S]MDM8159047.1 hypothetical protein [Labilibaculum sp. K2S]